LEATSGHTFSLKQRVENALQAEVENNRKKVASVLAEETSKIRTQLESFNTKLDQAQQVADEAKNKAAEASKLADDKASSKLPRKEQRLTPQIDAAKKQLSGALQTSAQLDTVKKELASTSDALKGSTETTGRYVGTGQVAFF
jgi:chaperonin cofactor prefoldin